MESFFSALSRGALHREFCYPVASGSMPDPDMSDPAGSGSELYPDHLDPAGSGSKPRLLYFVQEKNYSFCTAIGTNWNDCLPCFVTELLLDLVSDINCIELKGLS